MADLIIKGQVVLTKNENGDIINNGAVAVTGSKIVAVGPADQIESRHGTGAKLLQTRNGLVMPGLINGHTHVSMTCFRGLADDLPLMTWLHDHIFPAEAKLTGEMVYWGALLGCAEMIRSGTTFFCDMYLFEQDVARAVDKAGLRALLGEVLYDFPSPNYGPPEAGLKHTARLVDRYKGHDRLRIAVEPHSVYTCSPALLIACQRLAEECQVPLIIHLSENQEEVATTMKRYGTTPVRHLNRLAILDHNLIADHCVVMDEYEIQLMAEYGVKVVHNPRSNSKLSSGLAPVADMLTAGISVALGTDGPASNNNLDMFGEMHMASMLEKILKMDPTAMPAETVLNMATTLGAKAMGLDDQIGRLSPGFLADIIVLDLARPHLVPMYNPTSHLVYSANGGDVVHTVVGGRVLMENRRLTTLDLEEIYSQMDRISAIMTDTVRRS